MFSADSWKISEKIVKPISLLGIVVTRSEKVMSGAVVFSGTRVPVQTLIEWLWNRHSAPLVESACCVK
jgi:Protein of unknown function (DUF433)